MTIQSIETRYAGCRFRSRLEARWAKFFNTLGIPWLYEPEGFTLDDATHYLPDFLLNPGTESPAWFEVKARKPDEHEIDKCLRLAVETATDTYLYFDPGFQPAPAQPAVTSSNDFYSDFDWEPGVGGEYACAERPPAWMAGLAPTAYRFDGKSGLWSVHRPGPYWWTHCPHCDAFVLKLYGQVGWCPTFRDEDFDSIQPLYPNFGHRTPELKRAFEAARSARFEHGERG